MCLVNVKEITKESELWVLVGKMVFRKYYTFFYTGNKPNSSSFYFTPSFFPMNTGVELRKSVIDNTYELAKKQSKSFIKAKENRYYPAGIHTLMEPREEINVNKYQEVKHLRFCVDSRFYIDSLWFIVEPFIDIDTCSKVFIDELKMEAVSNVWIIKGFYCNIMDKEIYFPSQVHFYKVLEGNELRDIWLVGKKKNCKKVAKEIGGQYAVYIETIKKDECEIRNKVDLVNYIKSRY